MYYIDFHIAYSGNVLKGKFDKVIRDCCLGVLFFDVSDEFIVNNVLEIRNSHDEFILDNCFDIKSNFNNCIRYLMSSKYLQWHKAMEFIIYGYESDSIKKWLEYFKKDLIGKNDEERDSYQRFKVGNELFYYISFISLSSSRAFFPGKLNFPLLTSVFSTHTIVSCTVASPTSNSNANSF